MALNFPDSPSNGDTTTLNGVSYTYDSTKTVWVSTTGPITTVAVSDTAPTTPTAGDMWFNSADLKLYIRYNDGATSQWIIAAPAGPAGADSTVAGPAGAAGAAGGDGRAGVYANMAALIAKTGMVAGDTALVTALNKVFMYTGSAWYLIATMTNDSPTAITGVDGSYTLATDGTATTITAVSTDPEGFALTFSHSVTSGSLTVVPTALAVGVANSGASAYTLSGGVTGNNANVAIKVGQTVNFTVNASGHPFYIRDSNGGSNVSSPAATGQGAVSGVVSWTPNTVGTYYYQCGNHSAMVGTITVTAAGVTATVSQADNVFTITPSTDSANAGSFSLTFSVTDGATGAVNAVSAFTLSFGPATFTRTLETYVTGTNSSYYSNFGLNGAFSEDKYVIGTPEDNKAYLYNATNNTLVHTFSETPNSTTPAVSRFGGDVAISSNFVAVSAYNSGPNNNAPHYGQTGKIYIYNASTYAAVTNFQTFGSNRAFLGYNMAFTPNGNYLVATAPRVDWNSVPQGKVVVYDANNSWAATQISSPFSDEFANSTIGRGIGVTDTYIAIGSAWYDGTYSNDGRVDIFNATSPFAHVRSILPTGLTGLTDAFQFGYSVDAWDDYVIIGTATSVGAAYIYKMSTGALIVDLSTLVSGESTQFGSYVAMGPSGAMVSDPSTNIVHFFDVSDIANGNVTANGTRTKAEYGVGGFVAAGWGQGIKVSKVTERGMIGTYYSTQGGSSTQSRAYIYS